VAITKSSVARRMFFLSSITRLSVARRFLRLSLTRIQRAVSESCPTGQVGAFILP
jgi:hypothetical protein